MVLQSSNAFSQTVSNTEGFLRNSDIIRMVHTGMSAEAIVARIETSPCRFDIFPSVQRELRMRGVPEIVLEAMMAAPNGPPRKHKQPPPTKRLQLVIPNDTTVNVEAAYTVSSEKLKKGDPVTFLVSRPIYINGGLVIARNALASGRVVDVKKAQAWGRRGMLAWQMEYVVAVDGTRIPVSVSGGSVGKSRVTTMVAGAAITAAIVFPYTSPVALVWAFKKGEEAVLLGSQSFNARVTGNLPVASTVAGDDLPLQYAQALKAKSNAFTASSLPSSGNGFRPSGSFLPGASFLPSSSFLPQ
jgi:hypothetical protein